MTRVTTTEEAAVSTINSILSDLHHERLGSGPPLLFISGATGDAGHFTRVAQALADEYTTVTYDRRGCSRSAALPEAESMSIAAQAADAAELIEALGLAPAIVFGTSAGGNIALELTGQRPDVVRGALIHEPALITLAPDPEAEAAEFQPLLELAARDPREAMETFLRTVTSDTTFEGLDPELRERMLGNGAHFFASELDPISTYVPDADRLRAAGVAVCALASRDGMMEYGVRWLQEQLHVEVAVVSGHHGPYFQQPETLAEELRPILRTLDSSRHPRSEA